MVDTYSAVQKSYLFMGFLFLLTCIPSILLGLLFTGGIDETECVNFKKYVSYINNFNTNLKTYNVETIRNDLNDINNAITNTTKLIILPPTTDTDSTLISDLTTSITNYTSNLDLLDPISQKVYDITNIADDVKKTQVSIKDNSSVFTNTVANIVSIKKNISSLIEFLTTQVSNTQNDLDIKKKSIVDNTNTIKDETKKKENNTNYLTTYNNLKTELSNDRNEQIDKYNNINSTDYITNYFKNITLNITRCENQINSIQKQIDDNNSLLSKNIKDKSDKSDIKSEYEKKILVCVN